MGAKNKTLEQNSPIRSSIFLVVSLDNLSLEDMDKIDLMPATKEDAKNMVDEFNWIKRNNGNERVPNLRTELQESMTMDAGVFRTEESLLRQKKKLKELYNRYKNIRIDDKSNIIIQTFRGFRTWVI